MTPAADDAADSFCVYLARQLIAKHGFSPGTVPEAQRIAEQSDIVLSFFDGLSLTVIAMIDRDAHPDKAFTIPIADLVAIGKACLKHSRSVNWTKMPVTIRLMEIGGPSNDQQQHRRLAAIKRPSLFSKINLSAWAIDPANRSVWTNGGTRERRLRQFIEKLVASPREAVVMPAPVATAPAKTPWLTYAILAALCAMFALEHLLGIGPAGGALKPTIATLVAMGALSKSLVFQNGEWYRLLSAPFLHLDIVHLAMNCFGLFVAGRVLEPLIGRAWFAVIYIVSGLAGSAASVLLNPTSIVSVGASGAIMGLFAAMLVTSLRFPVGATRTSLQVNAIYTLIPSLLPLAGALQGQKVDYAAHFGGAFGGAAVALALLAIWSKSEPLPKWRKAAVAFAVVAAVTLAFPIIALSRGYASMAFTTHLIPLDRFPRTNPTNAQSIDLVTRYPRDPRAHLFRARRLLSTQDLAGAERAARTGLAEENIWRPIMPPAISNNLRAILAVAIVDKNRDEAAAVARPVCEALKDGAPRLLLDSRKLCET